MCLPEIFFCCHSKTHSKTHGINHLTKEEKRPTSYKTINKCVEKIESIGISSHLCNVCHLWEKETNPNLAYKDLRKKCKATRLGCPGCNNRLGVYVCKECWVTYHHTTKK